MIWNKLGKAVSFFPRKIDAKVEEEIAEKVRIGVLAALQQADSTIPILTTLLAGGTVRAEVSIKLIDTDGESVK